MGDNIDNSYWTLKALKSLGGSRSLISISSSELAEYMKISQQSASRFILELLKKGYIVRQMNGRKQDISITEKGMAVLVKEFADLSVILEKPVKMKLYGNVQSGLGEGRYYISRKGYIIQFQERLGFIPYLGTLNLRIKPGSELSLRKLRSMDGLHIDGFVTDDRTYGPVKAFTGNINGIRCAVIFPERSVYSDVLEVISIDYLRDSLSLKDGDELMVEVEGPFN